MTHMNLLRLHCTKQCSSALPADVVSLQQEDGSFAGDKWGEIDTRQVFNHQAVHA